MIVEIWQRQTCDVRIPPVTTALLSPLRVSFVIPVRDDARRLRACLDSIRRNHYPADLVEVIVVDNGSEDDSARVAREGRATVMSVRQGRVAELRNKGAAAARGEILAFVDADHEIGAGWIRAAATALSSDDRVVAAGALCDVPRDANWVQRQYDLLRAKPRGRQMPAGLAVGTWQSNAARSIASADSMRRLKPARTSTSAIERQPSDGGS